MKLPVTTSHFLLRIRVFSSSVCL